MKKKPVIWQLLADVDGGRYGYTYSTRRIMEVAKRRGIDFHVYTNKRIDLVVDKAYDGKVILDGKPVDLPDALLPRMIEPTYFGRAIIRHMEQFGVLTINPSRTLETVKDKLYTHQILVRNGIATPETIFAKYPLNVNVVGKELGYPLVVKTLLGSQGSGVILIDNKQQLNDFVKFVESLGSNRYMIIQRFIKASRGRDIRVFTIGGKAIACVMRIGKGDNFKSNLHQGGRSVPQKLTPEIKKIAERTSKVLGLEIGGIDLLIDDDGYVVAEANDSPGFKTIEYNHDISIPDLIFDYVLSKLK